MKYSAVLSTHIHIICTHLLEEPVFFVEYSAVLSTHIQIIRTHLLEEPAFFVEYSAVIKSLEIAGSGRTQFGINRSNGREL